MLIPIFLTVFIFCTLVVPADDVASLFLAKYMSISPPDALRNLASRLLAQAPTHSGDSVRLPLGPLTKALPFSPSASYIPGALPLFINSTVAPWSLSPKSAIVLSSVKASSDFLWLLSNLARGVHRGILLAAEYGVSLALSLVSVLSTPSASICGVLSMAWACDIFLGSVVLLVHVCAVLWIIAPRRTTSQELLVTSESAVHDAAHGSGVALEEPRSPNPAGFCPPARNGHEPHVPTNGAMKPILPHSYFKTIPLKRRLRRQSPALGSMKSRIPLSVRRHAAGAE